jgi:hypothetical protein
MIIIHYYLHIHLTFTTQITETLLIIVLDRD